MRHLSVAFFVLLVLCMPATAADSLESLERKLQALEQELPAILSDETDLDTQHDYVKRVLALREKIEAQKGQEQELADSGQRVLLLGSVKLKYRSKDSTYYQNDENYNTNGFASEDRDGNWARTLKVKEYPERIVIGEPFSFEAVAATSGGTSKIGVRIDRMRAASSLGHAQINIQAVGGRGASPSGSPPPITADIDFSFKRDFWQAGAQYGEYELDVQADGGFKNTNDYDHYPSAKTLILTKMLHSNITPLKGTALIFRFWVPSRYSSKEEEKHLEFVYHYANSNEKPVNVASFQLPDTSQPTEMAREDSASGVANEIAGTDRDNAITRRPHIEYWLANARPLENADPGYRLSFDQWGRVYGFAPNGLITVSGKPADAGVDSIGYVWSKADKLASLNLCTLQDYVKVKLEGGELQKCQIQNPESYAENYADGVGSLGNFVGMQAAKAKTRIENMGVRVKWKSGSIAKEPAQQGVVEKQQPKAGSSLRNLKEVELWVYRYAATSVLVPNVVGMMYADARARLKKEGLKAKFGKMDPSRPFTLNPKQKIVSQESAAGTKVATGTVVVLNFAKEGSEKRRTPLTLGGGKPGEQRIPDVLTRQQYEKERMPYPASAVDSKQEPARAPASYPSETSGAFDCETGIPGVIVETSGRLFPGRKNGVTQADKAQAKNYICRYRATGGKQYVAIITFFDKQPTTVDGKKWKDYMCAVYGLGRGKIPVYINQQGGVSLTDSVGKQNVTRFYNFHIQQIKPHAISCSAGGRSGTNTARSSGSENTARKLPNRMNCEAGIAGLRTDNKRRVASEQHEELGLRDSGRATYPCWYRTNRGDEVLVVSSFFATKPGIPVDDARYNMQSHCRSDKAYHRGVGKGGKAMRLRIGKYSANKLSAAQLQSLVNFHTGQMARYAVSCR